MVYRCLYILVFLFTKVQLDIVPSTGGIDPVLMAHYLGVNNDTFEKEDYFQFTTVNIFQPTYFPSDDPKLLAILRKHLEDPNNRKKSLIKLADAFERDQKKLKELREERHVKGLKTRMWPTLIPTGYMNTPVWFLKRTSDRTIFCHLCLRYFEDKVKFDKHYLRHFLDVKNISKLLKVKRTTSSLTTTILTTTTTASTFTTTPSTIKIVCINMSNKIRRRVKVLRTRTTVLTGDHLNP